MAKSENESPAVSIRIPREILAKIDKLAEEKYRSHKGTPNRSLVILDAIVNYFDTVSGIESSLPSPPGVSDATHIVTDDVMPIVMQRLEVLEGIIHTLYDTVNNHVFEKIESLEQNINTLSDTVDKLPKTKLNEPTHKQLSIQSTVSDSKIELSDGKTDNNEIRIDRKLLAKRFKLLNPRSIYSTKYKPTDPEFTNWSASKDLDGIPWRYCKEGDKDDYFVPAAEPSEELKTKLLTWVKQELTGLSE